MTKRLLLLVILIQKIIMAWAVPASPVPLVVSQPDGTLLTVRLCGDEHFHYLETTDHVLLQYQQGAYYIAAVNANGQLGATSQLAHQPEQRSDQETALVRAQDRNTFFRENSDVQRAGSNPRRESVQGYNLFPHMGTPRAAAILVAFCDTPFTLPNPRASFHQYLNGEGAPQDYANNESANEMSVAQYFSRASLGQFTPQFDVYGPVVLGHPLAYYGSEGTSSYGDNMTALLEDACSAADEQINFADYDADNNGLVDLVCIIFAGYGENYAGNPSETIWPKAGSVASISTTFDGKNIRRYLVSNELYGRQGNTSIEGIGVFCHEFSHCLGLPDLYPTVSAAQLDNQAMEMWSLMDGGEYHCRGNYPTGYTAWEREAMGWTVIEELTCDTTLQLRTIDDGGTAYRIRNKANEREYFIMENQRMTRSYYASQSPWSGMLVYHVCYSSPTVSLSDRPNNKPGKPEMAIVPADGLLLSSFSIGQPAPDGYNHYTYADYYTQHAGDPFPGASGVRELSRQQALPNFTFYTGEPPQFRFSNITETGNVVTVSFHAGEASGIAALEAIRRNEKTYTLTGLRVEDDGQSLPQGIYIKNGKKKYIQR